MPIHFISVSSASGSGKSSIVGDTLKQTKLVKLVLSTTTRPRRDDDRPGEYEYITHAKFYALLAKSAFLWTSEYANQMYGTRKTAAMGVLSEKELGILIITPLSVAILKNYFPNMVYAIYVSAPPPHIRDKRITARGDDPASVADRIKEQASWDTYAMTSGLFDQFITNNGPLHFAVAKVFQKIVELKKQ